MKIQLKTTKIQKLQKTPYIFMMDADDDVTLKQSFDKIFLKKLEKSQKNIKNLKISFKKK